MKRKKRTLKKILVRGLALLGATNIICTIFSVLVGAIFLLAVCMQKVSLATIVTPIEGFAYYYIRLAYTSHWAVTVLTVISMIWAFLWLWVLGRRK